LRRTVTVSFIIVVAVTVAGRPYSDYTACVLRSLTRGGMARLSWSLWQTVYALPCFVLAV